MPTQTSQLINSIPNIANKKYLELGAENGNTYLDVKCKFKLGVDINPLFKDPSVYVCTTDAFFEMRQVCNLKFDVIYIDACHEVNQVVKDYNNAVRFINHNNGIILMHDMGPRTREECEQDNVSCGTAYKFITYIRKYRMGLKYPELNIVQLSDNVGITLVMPVFYNLEFDHDKLNSITYEEYLEHVVPRAPSTDEMCLILQKSML